MLYNSFYEAGIILLQKLVKGIMNKENYLPFSLINIEEKILNKILAVQTKQWSNNLTLMI